MAAVGDLDLTGIPSVGMEDDKVTCSGLLIRAISVGKFQIMVAAGTVETVLCLIRLPFSRLKS